MSGRFLNLALVLVLVLVLDVLCKSPFGPMESVNLKILFYKLGSLASAQRVGDLYALSMKLATLR